MLLEVVVQVEGIQIDFRGQVFVRPILVDEELDICLGTYELCLLLDNLGLSLYFGSKRAHVLHHFLQVVLHEVYA